VFILQNLFCKKIYFNSLRILCFSFIIYFCACADNKAQYPRLPIYEGASNIKYISRENIGYGIDYQMKIYYPANDLIDYYLRNLQNMGFEKISKTSPNKWGFFNDGTIKGNPNVASKEIEWSSKEMKLDAFLELKYYDYINNGFLGNDKLSVRFYFLNRRRGNREQKVPGLEMGQIEKNSVRTQGRP
jgi:hypothetical protein